MNSSHLLLRAFASAGLVLVTACHADESARTTPPPAEFASDAAVAAPAVDDLETEMHTLSLLHRSLGIAGSSGDWEAVGKRLGDFEDAFLRLRRNHPRVPGHDLATAVALDRYTAAPRVALRAAHAGRDAAGFREGYDALTAACNSCHEAYGRAGASLGTW